MRSSFSQSALVRFLGIVFRGESSVRFASMFAAAGRSSVAAAVMVLAPAIAWAAPDVEFDLARTVECRDITPGERLAQYPLQRCSRLCCPCRFVLTMCYQRMSTRSVSR